jgi:hypothetical protein
MRFVLLLMMCLGCSAGAPTTYNQGAFRSPPRAPAFSPTTDAPHTVGQPGHLKPIPQMEPGPKPKRLLPPQIGPGVWASDEPDPGHVEPRLFGVLMPVPSDVTDYDRKAVYKCIFVMSDFAIRATGGTADAMTARLEKYADRERGCIAATLYATCLKSIKDHYNSEFERGAIYDPEVAVGLQRLIGAANKSRDSLCHHTPIGADGKRLMDDVIAKWRTALGT